MDTIEIVWAALIIVFLIIEGLSPALTSIWFAAGAIAGLILSLSGLDVVWQIAAFIVVSVVALILTRPLAKKFVNRKIQPTNADRVVGQTGIVTEDIDNIAETGAAKIGGKIWTARSESGSPIATGTIVTGVSITGNTLKVLVNGKTGAEPGMAGKTE